MKNTKLLAVASLVAALIAVNTPAQASFLSDLKNEFHNHCSISGLSITCSDSHETVIVVQLPDGTIASVTRSVSQGQIGKFNPKCKSVFETYEAPGVCVFHSTAEDGFYHSSTIVLTKVPGAKMDEYECHTKSVTGKLIPPSVTYSNMTTPGHC